MLELALHFALILVISLTFAGCEKEEAKKVSLLKDKEQKEMSTKGDALKVAIGAMVSPGHTFEYYEQLLDYLSKKMGKPIVLSQRKAYLEVNELLERENVELGFICAGPYVEAHDNFGVEILVVPVVNGETHYFSYIIVHKDSDINRFEDLQGKTFAFTDPLSLTGTIFPTYLLAQKGYTPEEYFSKAIFTHSHDNSIIAVAEKLVDGAGVDCLIWDYFSITDPGLTSRTKIILRSLPFGIPPVVVPKNLDPALKEKLRKIFLNLHNEEESKAILSKLMIDKFVKGADASYDEIRQMKRFVEGVR